MKNDDDDDDDDGGGGDDDDDSNDNGCHVEFINGSLVGSFDWKK